MPHDKGINHASLRDIHPSTALSMRSSASAGANRGAHWNVLGKVSPSRRGEVKHMHFGTAGLEASARKNAHLSSPAVTLQRVWNCDAIQERPSEVAMLQFAFLGVIAKEAR